ncbi:hypothetical protein OXX80_004397 [Metschnikowia pulcherrima]
MIEFNYKDEIVSSPAVIVSGRTSAYDRGFVNFVNNNSEAIPPQAFEVNNSQFKALLHVSPGENNFQVYHVNAGISGNPGQNGSSNSGCDTIDEGRLTLHYQALPANKPIHLCVILGKDSMGAYDMPSYKSRRGEPSNLDAAVQKLKVAGRMMQAFTQDEFHHLGLSNRCFQFVEEQTTSQSLFGRNNHASAPHTEVKVHVIRSPKTVAQLRDPDLAQQNPDAKNNGGLFSHAIDLVQKQDFYRPYAQLHTPIQCAVVYLDSTWNGRFITTHAALGGGTHQVKMAIFGSHGLHSFPSTFDQMTACFLDDTELSTKEVANDNNQCGTSWECLNICMGAFIHEIGHSLGSPHQVDGVMLRDYIWWNRSFMTREARCLRDNSPGCVIGNDGNFPRTCHWNIMDIMRYFYHGSFSIPTDVNDASFPKSETTLLETPKGNPVPSMFMTEPGKVVVKSATGIFMVELVGEDLARHHIRFYPKSYGGRGLPSELALNFDECLRDFRNGWKSSADNFDLRVLSVSGDLWVPNFKSKCYPSRDSVIEHDFNLGRGPIRGIKSDLLGSAKGGMQFIGFDAARVYKVRVYHGGALDGMTFYYRGDKIDQEEKFDEKHSKRHLLKKFLGSTSSHQAYVNAGDVTIGNRKDHYTDFQIPEGERIVKFSFRNGQWMDAVQIETNTGRKSAMLGNSQGGHLSILEPPTTQHQIVGLYGYTGSWMDGIGLIYARI